MVSIADMHLFFANHQNSDFGRPFLLDGQMRWRLAPNHFLFDISRIDGATSSPNTWRAYAYHLLDWFRFLEAANLEWDKVRERHLAEYRNVLYTKPSDHTGRQLTRGTVNGRLGSICLFYQFAVNQGYLNKLPYSFKEVRLNRNVGLAPIGYSSKMGRVNRLMLPTYEQEFEVPPNDQVGQFIQRFAGKQSWRNKLMAEILWLTGMRRCEVCSMSIHQVPEDPFSLAQSVKKILITGKGGKLRWINFPVRLLRGISRYVALVRTPTLKRNRVDTDNLWVAASGQSLRPAGLNKAFSVNARRCNIELTPHLLRHSYAVNRLLYLESKGIKGALKLLQLELGHSSISTTGRYLHLTDKMRGEVISSHQEFIDQLTKHLRVDEQMLRNSNSPSVSNR